MTNFLIFGDDGCGELEPLFASNDGRWKCLCCGRMLTFEMLSSLLKQQSAMDEESTEIGETV